MTKCSCGVHHYQKEQLQNNSRYDPTKTTTLRNQYARKIKSKFKELAKTIKMAIVEQDCLALRPGLPIRPFTFQTNMALPGEKAFDFPLSSQKIKSFMEWVNEQVENDILEIHIPEGNRWYDAYIQSAYRKGVTNARQQLIQFGVPGIEKTGGIDVVLNSPFHINRLANLYMRNFAGLKGITAAMDTQISRVLARGLGEGRNPRQIAEMLNAVIFDMKKDLGVKDAIGRFIPAGRRAEMLARTEIIRTHHQAMIEEYRAWAVEEVTVKAEWATAGDNRVCPECEDKEGKIYTLDEIQELIPFHPLCRCMALPVDTKKEKKTTTKKAPRKIEQDAVLAPFKNEDRIIREMAFPNTTLDTLVGESVKKYFPDDYSALQPLEQFNPAKISFPGRKKDLSELAKKTIVKRYVDAVKKIPRAEDFLKTIALSHVEQYDDPIAEGIASLIHQWAETSADNSPSSLWLQHLVAKEFGLPSPEFLVAKMKKEVLDTISDRIAKVVLNLGRLPYEERLVAGRKEFEQLEKVGRKILRMMYQTTQEGLKEQGIDYVTLYRGIGEPRGGWENYLKGRRHVLKLSHKSELFDDIYKGFFGPDGTPEAEKYGKLFEYRGHVDAKVKKDAEAIFRKLTNVEVSVSEQFFQPISSFSSSPDIAVNFASTSIDGALSLNSTPQAILVARVPRERIFALPAYGFGCYRESEFVVLGGLQEAITIFLPVGDRGLYDEGARITVTNALFEAIKEKSKAYKKLVDFVKNAGFEPRKSLRRGDRHTIPAILEYYFKQIGLWK